MGFKKIVQSNLVFAMLTTFLLILNFYFFNRQASVPQIGPHFTLQGAEGKVSEKSIRGYWTLFYFGYTFCPDVCPTSLSYWSSTLNSLSPDELKKTKFYFVSVDPERDTFERVKTYTKHFHPHMNALWAAKEDIKPVADQFGVVFSYYKDPTKEYYTVDHSAYTILLNPDGEIVYKFEHGMVPAEVTDKLRSLMKHNQIEGD